MSSENRSDGQSRGLETLAPGSVVSHYEIVSKIGSGGMGDVYKAIDQRLNRPVAIKTLRPEFFDDPDRIARFTREAVTTAKINHPHIMSVYDVGETGLESGQSLHYIVMEFIDGQGLDAYVKSRELSTPDLLRLSEKLGSALAAAHKLGVVHRDIKMDNVMINADGEPKILDFGLAKPVVKAFLEDSAGVSGTATMARDLTQESKIVGTVSYMSPEQARGDTVDHRSDIFSFGILLYRLFAGKLPFEGNDRVSIIAKILEAPHEPIRIVDQSLPAELERIISKCLQKKPEDRYQDTRDLVVDIRSLRRQFDSNISDSISGTYESPQLRSPGAKRLWSIPIWAVLAAAVIIIGLASWEFLDIRSWFTASSGNKPENALAVLSFDNLSDPDDQQRYGQILQELVLTDLSDNAPIRLISSQRLFDIQKKLGYRDRVRIDREIATDVAREAGAGIMLAGNLIQTGDIWIITGQLIDVIDGTLLAAHRLEGSDIYTIVDSLSGRVRNHFSRSGLSESSDLSIRDKTSVSMDAFRHYLVGTDLLNDTDYRGAINELKKAIEIDPGFNKAYYKMAIAQWWSEDTASDAGRESIRNILDNERYSTERERAIAIGALALMDRDYVKAMENYQMLSEQYSDDKEVWYGLGEALYHYSEQTRERALEAFERAIELDVGFALAYRHVFELYFNYGRIDQALEKANNLIVVKPESPTGYRYLAAANILKGDSLEIERSIEKALQHHLDPNDKARLYFDLLFSFAHVGSLDRAEEYAGKMFQMTVPLGDKERVQAWGELMRLYNAAGMERKSDSILDEALASDIAESRKLTVLSNLAQSYFNQFEGREKARSLLERGLKMDTSGIGSNIRAARGQLAIEERRYDEAERYARDALAIVDGNVSDWAGNILYESYLFRGQYGKALEFAADWLEEHPDLVSGYLYFIQAYVYSNQYAKADSVLESAMEENGTVSQQVMLLRNAATCYRNIGEYAKGLDLMQRAYALDENQLLVLYNTARFHELLGNYMQADELYRQILDENASDVSTMVSVGRVWMRQGNFNKAKSRYEKALAVDSANDLPWRMLGYLYSVQKQYDQAIGYVRKALELDRSYFSYNLLAWLLVAGDIDIDQGVALAQRVLANPPSGNPFDTHVRESPFVPLPEYTLGLGYMKKGDFTSALSYLENAALLRPDDKEIARDLGLCRQRIKS